MNEVLGNLNTTGSDSWKENKRGSIRVVVKYFLL